MLFFDHDYPDYPDLQFDNLGLPGSTCFVAFSYEGNSPTPDRVGMS